MGMAGGKKKQREKENSPQPLLSTEAGELVLITVEDERGTKLTLLAMVKLGDGLEGWKSQVVLNEVADRMMKGVVLALPHTNFYLSDVKVVK